MRVYMNMNERLRLDTDLFGKMCVNNEFVWNIEIY